MNNIIDFSKYEIAVIIPCYNEEVAIATVVKDFKKALPTATVYVYDNNSKDKTKEVALNAGAVVRTETHQGKGNVVRRMFSDVDADIYIMVDGDDTYDAFSAPKMIEKLVTEKLDMLVGTRVTEEQAAYRSGHRFGNMMLTGCATYLFGKATSDMLSGYRVFSKRFVKSFPSLAAGFETETELTVHALSLRMPIGEMVTPYKSRPAGSVSKLSTYKDGIRILLAIIKFFEQERPLMFFALLGLFFAFVSIILSIPLFITYFETGLVPRFPTAILVSGLMVLSFLSLVCGLVLNTVTRGRQEMKRLFYLSIKSV